MKVFRLLLGSVFILFFLLLLTSFRHKIKNFLPDSRPSDDITLQKLKAENERLKRELTRLKEKPLTKKFNYTEAEVYSHYPFNDRSLVTINVGKEDGLKPKMPVLSKEEILIGEVKGVTRTLSEVKTIFDPAWVSSVAVGESKVKAVLKGGIVPKLDLIPKSAQVQEGDSIINISREFPLGLLIGTLQQLKIGRDDAWSTALVKPFYEPEELNYVLVILDFP